MNINIPRQNPISSTPTFHSINNQGCDYGVPVICQSQRAKYAVATGVSYQAKDGGCQTSPKAMPSTLSLLDTRTKQRMESVRQARRQCQERYGHGTFVPKQRLKVRWKSPEAAAGIIGLEYAQLAGSKISGAGLPLL